MTAALIEDLKARGLISQTTADAEFIEYLESIQKSFTFFCVFIKKLIFVQKI